MNLICTECSAYDSRLIATPHRHKCSKCRGAVEELIYEGQSDLYHEPTQKIIGVSVMKTRKGNGDRYYVDHANSTCIPIEKQLVTIEVWVAT
jgi:hypothetical protein